MNTITKHVVLLALCLIVGLCSAQETQKDSVVDQKTPNKEVGLKIINLEELKNTITAKEKEFLKQEVEAINKRFDNGEISKEEADKLKKEAAIRRAANIEDRIAIIDAKINLLKRNPDSDHVITDENSMSINIGSRGFFIDLKDKKTKPKKYDKRTTSEFVFALGANNAIIDGKDIGDTYSVLGSGFVELGLSWKTRLFKESNAVRLKYGLSFQWNKFTPKDDKYFVQNDNVTTLEEFPNDLREAEFRVSTLVVPVHFEFGPSRKIDYDTHFRYSTRRQLKFGIGGYAGFNIGTQQKLRYKEDGDRVKQKIKRSYNTSDFIYGLSAYVGIDEVSLYMKYDLNPVFKDQAVDQHNISLGLRLDLD